MKQKIVHRFTAALCTLALLLASLTPAAAAGASGFTDVKSGDWCYDAVVWAVEKGITSGTTATTFSPGATCNNAQILTFLWRAAGQPQASGANPFRNLSSGAYYYQAALWAHENGLVSGDSFDAEADCTRAMAVTYIWQAKGMPFSSAPASFTDVPMGDYALSMPVAWAVESGVTSGTTATTFSPNNTCTRGQIVTFLKRAYGGGASAGIVPVPSAPSAPASGGTQAMSEECTELLKSINARRTGAGLNALTANGSLTRAANIRADDISKGYMDVRADGSSWDSVVTGLPSTAASLHETMTGGSGTASGILAIMLNDPDASAAMMEGSYTQVGIGHVYNANGYGGFKDFWSLLYISDSGSSSGADAPAPAPMPSGFNPVPMSDLANRKSLQKKATDEQLAQAYAKALELVRPLAGLSREEQLQGIAAAVRQLFDEGMEYSTSAPHYNDPYGYFVLGTASCAGCTRATGLCLNILGIPYEHVNESQYTHQWCRVNVNGTYWICDAYGLYCGPEPAPYTHPYF